MLIALHLLQNHAPSNLNRDDNGDPKDCVFGGVRRARISSQSLKRSIRWSPTFRSYFADESQDLAQRTQLLPELVRQRINTHDLDTESSEAVVRAAMRIGTAEKAAPVGEMTRAPRKTKRSAESENNAPKRTAQLMFLSSSEIDELSAALVRIVQEDGISVLDGLTGDKISEKVGIFEPHAADIAMFGRMTTSSPFKNIEAAVQVAHAISTHAVEQEFDFYTAVDDISGESGAGFIGEVSFNSSVYYKYFSIDWTGLLSNLHGDAAIAAAAVRGLIHAAILAHPSGKQNSFAAHNPPDVAIVEVRRDRIALSYANAFVQPVRATPQQSLTAASADALARYIPQLNRLYDLHADRALLSTLPIDIADTRACASLGELIAWLPIERQEGR